MDTLFPTALDNDTTLVTEQFGAQGTLTAPVTATDTVLPLGDTAEWPDTGIAILYQEHVLYTGKTATELTGCVRGFLRQDGGSSAISHDAGIRVKQATPNTSAPYRSAMWRVQNAAIRALQTHVGIGELFTSEKIITALGYTPADGADIGPILADIAALETGKQDALGYTPANKAGETFTGDIEIEVINGIPTFRVQSEQGAGFFPATIVFDRPGVGGGATPDNTQIGRFLFQVRDSTGALVTPAIFSATIGANVVGGPGAVLAFATTRAGETSATSRILIDSLGRVYFNSSSADADFIVRGLTDPNLIHTDASTDRVGIGTTTPQNKLDVAGTVQADGLRLDVVPTAETLTLTHTITVNINGTNYRIPIAV